MWTKGTNNSDWVVWLRVRNIGKQEVSISPRLRIHCFCPREQRARETVVEISWAYRCLVWTVQGSCGYPIYLSQLIEVLI